MSPHETARELAQANRDELAFMLDGIRAKRIRAFLAAPGADLGLELAFWRLVYWNTPQTTHETALAVARELEGSGRRVYELVDGSYVPAALAAPVD